MNGFVELVQSLNPSMGRLFHKGTVETLDTYARATTLPADGQWGKGRQGFGIQHTSTPTVVTDAAEQQGTSGTLFVETGCAPVPTSTQYLMTKRSAAGQMWRFLIGAPSQTLQLVTSAGASVLTVAWEGSCGFAVSFADSATPLFYLDGVSAGAGGSAVSIATENVQINIGARYDAALPLSVPVHCAVQFPSVLTPEQISNLHHEFRKLRTDARETTRVVVPVDINPAGITEVETFGAELDVQGNLVGKRGVSKGTILEPVTTTKDVGFSEGALVGHTSTSGITLSNPATLAPVDNGAFECVLIPRVSTPPGAQYPLVCNASSNTLIYQTVGGQWAAVKGSGASTILSPAGSARAGVPTHLLVTWWLDGLTRRFQFFVNGVSQGVGTFTGSVVATSARLLGDGSSLGWSGQCAVPRFYDQHVTEDQARALYLESALAGAELDNSEFMPPITFASQSSGNLGPWQIGSGSWGVEDNGLRTIINASSGWAARPCNGSFGAWYWRSAKDNASAINLALLASVRAAPTDAAQNSYNVYISTTEAIQFYRVTGGAGTLLFSTGVDYITPDVEYEYFLTRRYDGLFTLYIRGGAYATWTVVGSGTDTTHTACSFQVADLDTGDSLSSFHFYPLGGTLAPGDVPGLED